MREQHTEINRSFFERNPKAAALRQACIEFILAWRDLSQATDSDRVVHQSRLEEARNHLQELGAAPGMHQGKNFEYFRSRPVAAAQYCAGQLLGRQPAEASDIDLNTAYDRLDNVGSHNIGEGVEAAVLDGRDSKHAEVLKLAIPRDVIRIVAEMLDANTEVWGRQ